MSRAASFTQADIKRAATVACSLGMRVVVRKTVEGAEIALEPMPDSATEEKTAIDSSAQPKQW